LADICAQYLKKGSKVYIEGRLQTRDWEGQDGVRRYKTEIIADNMIMLDRAGAGSGASAGNFSKNSEPMIENAPAAEAAPTAPNNDDEIRIEDIPF
jgi:single-strand DNA-binding protein